MTLATKAALADALANREAILSLSVPVPDWLGEVDEWVKLDCQLRTWFGETKLIDFGLIRKRLAA